MRVYLRMLVVCTCIIGVSGSFEVFCVYTYESYFVRASQFAFRKLLGKGLLSMLCSSYVCFSLEKERGGEREREREREKERKREKERERERGGGGDENIIS